MQERTPFQDPRPEGESNPDEEREAELAAAEAASIGGRPGGPPRPPAQQPLAEAGEGEAEGFEEAEELLIEHASHGDQQSAHTVLRDQGAPEEPDPWRADGEPDHEDSSEVDEDVGG
jgi:hypothetical protein